MTTTPLVEPVVAGPPAAARVRRGRAPWRALRAAEAGWAWLTLAGCYLAACWATVVTRPAWDPDSRLYLAWAYRFLGRTPAEAAQLSRDFLQGRDGVGQCAGLCWPPGYEHAWFSGATGALVGGRPLYPLLSAPFVGLVGPWGMLVVPFVGFTVAVLAVVVLAQRLCGRHWGLLAGLALVAPVTVSRWALSAAPEGLAIGLTAAALLVLPLRRATRRADLVWFCVLLVLDLCVLRSAAVLVAGVLAGWAWVAVRQRWTRNPWWPFAALALPLLALALGMRTWATARFVDGGTDPAGPYRRTVGHLLAAAGGPGWGPHLLRYAGGADQAAIRADLPLAATLGVAAVAVAWRWRSELTALALGLATASLALGVAAGGPPRYRDVVPAHAALLLVAVALLADLAARPRRRPARSTEDGPPAGPVPAQPPPVGRPALRIPRLGWLLVGLLLAVASSLAQRHPAGPAVAARPWALLAGLALLALAVAVLTLLVDRRFGPGAAVAAGSVLALCSLVVAAAEVDLSAAVVLAAAAGVAALLLVPPAPRDSLPVAACFGVLVASAVVARPVGLALVGGVLAAAGAALARGRSPRRAWLGYAAVAVLAGAAGLAWRWLRTGAPLGGAHPLPVDRLVPADFRALAPDRVLYLLVLVGLVGLLVRLRRPEGALAAGIVPAALLLHGAHPGGPADLLVAVPGLLLAAVALLVPLLAARENAPATPHGGG